MTVDFGIPLNTGVIKNFRLILPRTMVGMLGGAEFYEHMTAGETAYFCGLAGAQRKKGMYGTGHKRHHEKKGNYAQASHVFIPPCFA